MRISWGTVHGAILIGWIAIAVAIAIGTAMLGGEETRLKMQRGEDRRDQLELVHRTDQLRAQLERETRADFIKTAVRHLALPLKPETTDERQLLAMGRTE